MKKLVVEFVRSEYGYPFRKETTEYETYTISDCDDISEVERFLQSISENNSDVIIGKYNPALTGTDFHKSYRGIAAVMFENYNGTVVRYLVERCSYLSTGMYLSISTEPAKFPEECLKKKV